MTLKQRLYGLKLQPTPAKLHEFFDAIVEEIEALKSKKEQSKTPELSAH